MKYLVTGGNGFIGKAFCDAAKARGDDVFVIDKQGVFPVDLANGTALNNMVEKCKPDWVIHLAATPGTGNGKDDVGAAAFQDVFNTRNLLQAMQLAGCKKILFASTGSVYNTMEYPTPTNATVGPIAFYAAGKLACEGFIQSWCNAQDGTGVVLRLGTVIGPGNSKGLIKDFVRKMHNGTTEMQIMGDGTQTKSYVHIDDLVAAMLMATTDRDPIWFSVKNIATGDNTWTVTKVADKIASVLGMPTPRLVPGEPPFGDVHRIDLASGMLNSRTVAEAIEDNVEWLLEHPEVFE